MNENLNIGISGHLAASFHLLGVSLRRQLRSRQTAVNFVVLAFAAVAVVAWTQRRERTAAEFIEDILLTIHVTFLLPVFCLSYATSGIASEREERTLVYLLMTPLPRPWIFAAKSLAALLLSLAWTLGGLLLLGWLAGEQGFVAVREIWPAVAWSTCAYVALFLLFSVLFYRATILALAYALFLEVFVGNLPGIAKRLTISFYTRCMVFDAGGELGMTLTGPFHPDLFLPIPGAKAEAILCTVCAVLFVGGLIVFTLREYAR